MYITFQEYTALYDFIGEKAFNRLSFEACKYIDRLTTGVDGIKKLKVAMPTEDDDKAAVSMCAAHVINLLHQIEEAEQSASLSRGLVLTGAGLHGKLVSSVSSGSETISYSTTHANTVIDAAISNDAEREKIIYRTIRRYLTGAKDANGVNLLYMGVYPA